ncbi:MAG: hypothetical protein IKQ31_00580 [Clostridia bacterium]|nr:hypothetical protein [Clostridia bacterium]
MIENKREEIVSDYNKKNPWLKTNKTVAISYVDMGCVNKVPLSLEEVEYFKDSIIFNARYKTIEYFHDIINSDEYSAEEREKAAGILKTIATRINRNEIKGQFNVMQARGYDSSASIAELCSACEELSEVNDRFDFRLEDEPITFDLTDLELTKENIDNLLYNRQHAIDYVKDNFPNYNNFVIHKTDLSPQEIEALGYLKQQCNEDVSIYICDKIYMCGEVREVDGKREEYLREDGIYYELDRVVEANKKAEEFITKIKQENLTPLEAYLRMYKFATEKAYAFDNLDVDDRSFVGVMTTDSRVCAGYAMLLSKMCELYGDERVKVDYIDGDDRIEKDEPGHAFCRVTLEDEDYGIKGEYIADPTANASVARSEEEAKVEKKAFKLCNLKLKKQYEAEVSNCLIPAKQVHNYFVGRFFNEDSENIMTTVGNEVSDSKALDYKTYKKALSSMYAKSQPELSYFQRRAKVNNDIGCTAMDNYLNNLRSNNEYVDKLFRQKDEFEWRIRDDINHVKIKTGSYISGLKDMVRKVEDKIGVDKVHLELKNKLDDLIANHILHKEVEKGAEIIDEPIIIRNQLSIEQRPEQETELKVEQTKDNINQDSSPKPKEPFEQEMIL